MRASVALAVRPGVARAHARKAAARALAVLEASPPTHVLLVTFRN